MATAVVAWQAGQDDVRDVLVREGVPAVLGPHRGGWSVVRLLADSHVAVEPRGRTVVDLVDDVARTLGVPGATCQLEECGARRLIVCSGTEAPVTAELPPLGSDKALHRPAWAALLRAIEAGSRLEQVLDAAASGLGGTAHRRERVATAMRDDRPWRVAQAAGLPPQLLDPELVGDPNPAREAVFAPKVDPGDPDIVASAVGLPLSVTWFGNGVLVTAEPPDATGLLPVAAGLASGRRRTALIVWRQGDTRGYVLCRRGTVENAHVWSVDWELLPIDATLQDEFREFLREGLRPAEGDARLLLDRLGATDVDAAEVRVLLRRPPGPDVLDRFCTLLGLPPRLADVVEGADPAALPGSRPVRPTTRMRTVLKAAGEPRADDPWLVRVTHEKPWWYRAATAAWAPLASVLAFELWPGDAAGKAVAVAVAASAVASVVSAVRPGKKGKPSVNGESSVRG